MASVDDLKCFSDSFDFGEVRQDTPLQAAMVSERLGSDDQTEECLAKYATALANADSSATSLRSSSSPIVDDKLLKSPILASLVLGSLPSSSSRSHRSSDRDCAVESSLALVNQLRPFRAYAISQVQEAFRAEVEAMQAQAQVETSRAKEETAEARRSLADLERQKRSRPRDREGVENKDSNSKANPFETAKRRFVKDEDGDLGSLAKTQKGANGAGAGSSRVIGAASGGKSSAGGDAERELPPELAHLDRNLVDKIESDIVVRGQVVSFDDIAGLERAKECVRELICWPMTRPDIFIGLRSLPKGLLLFGPPGTGKTLIGKAIAHEAGATFFSISASSLTSKWIGEGEKMVRTLFAVAAHLQPSVVFIDEVDSLLCARNSDENEATRRLKTEFLVQLDGAGTDQSARVVIVGATNRPDELDEAARRRFVKRIYIPLPDKAGRRQLVSNLLGKCDGHALTASDVTSLVVQTKGFSGADIANLCTEAALGPVREIAIRFKGNLKLIKNDDVPPVHMRHFLGALDRVQPSVSPGDLQRYLKWNDLFGTYKEVTVDESVIALGRESEN